MGLVRTIKPVPVYLYGLAPIQILEKAIPSSKHKASLLKKFVSSSLSISLVAQVCFAELRNCDLIGNFKCSISLVQRRRL